MDDFICGPQIDEYIPDYYEEDELENGWFYDEMGFCAEATLEDLIND